MCHNDDNEDRICKEPTSRLWTVAAVALSCWIIGWLWLSRWHLLDDALIHLRYAINLAQQGVFSYDGVTPTFGTSSPGYLLVLAALSLPIGHAVWLPKLVSTVAYLAGLVLAIVAFRRSVGRARLMTGVLILALSSPMALRWLTDGMETSLAVLVASLVARWGRGRGSRHLDFLTGAVAVAVRVEFVLLVGLAAMSLVFREGLKGPAIKRAAWLALGGAATPVALWIYFGQMLPDPAAAKSAGSSLSALVGVLSAHVSSMSLGLGLAGVYLASFWLASRLRAGSGLPSVLLMNLGPLVLVAFAVARGQAIEGVRYFLPLEVFAIVANLAELSLPPRQPSTTRRPFLLAVVALFFSVWCAEAPLTARILSARAYTLTIMQKQPLHILEHELGIAGDIGFIGYFSRAALCDLGGLVNGREFAQLPRGERVRRCAETRSNFLFVNEVQGRTLQPHLDFASWVVCHTYAFPNLRGDDVHYLVVKPGIASALCPAPLGLASALWPDHR